MAELNEKQRVFVEGLQKSIDDNTFAPETLNPLQVSAIDKLIKSKVLKSKPLKEIFDERTQAREDLAKQETVAQDPLGAFLVWTNPQCQELTFYYQVEVVLY